MILTLPEAKACSPQEESRDWTIICIHKTSKGPEKRVSSKPYIAIKPVLPLAAKSLTVQCLRRGD